MTGKTHLSIGLAITVAASKYTKFDMSLASIGVCAVASVLPDIDHPKSLINKYILPFKNKSSKAALYITIGIFILFINLFYFSLGHITALGIFFIIIGISTHREGLIHSLTGLISMSIIFGYTAASVGIKECSIPFFIGYLTHIISDMFTNRGVPIFYPFMKKKFKMPFTFAVGSWQGKLFEGIATAACLIYLTWQVPYLLMHLK